MTRAATLLLAAAIAAQPPTFRTGIERVELDVSVMHRNVPVAGLTADDFALTDNGVAQVVESVGVDRLPLSVTLVLDTSSSVSGGRLRSLIEASDAVLAGLRPADRVALITFANAIQQRVAMTHDPADVHAALGMLAGGGATALRDAVHLAIETSPRDETRPLVLVFTDGKDTASWLTRNAVLDTVRRASVVVHTIGVGFDGDPILSALADASGGRTWSATFDSHLRDAFTRALEEMRARYRLRYEPVGVKTPGWHELKVKLKTGRGDITARPGYFVAAEP
jgi:VWFA-related protein